MPLSPRITYSLGLQLLLRQRHLGRVQTWSQLSSLTTSTHTTQIKAWWTNLIHTNAGQPETSRVHIITYTAWNLWKERCRRVFDNKAYMPQQLLECIRHDVGALRYAQEEYV
ncbi:hypothetical protein HU200_062895 [Digitaria exilis]|uniref:Uncharacterized protein n=1 Tax=Digitaria exilis TaxID=1010633 RepID=A0A835A2I5_9POAL|nr:hypothetical protein HU200_062895 [Digitaria exilis]